MIVGVVDDILTPMFGMLVGSFQTMKPVEGEGFQLNMLEMSLEETMSQIYIQHPILHPPKATRKATRNCNERQANHD